MQTLISYIIENNITGNENLADYPSHLPTQRVLMFVSYTQYTANIMHSLLLWPLDT